MKFDVFFSICQTEVDGYLPTERTMFQNFFDQVKLADELGYETAWLAESHLSCEVQKHNSGAVIPQFKGEIGLNTDALQLAHRIFAQTKSIHVGSAIRSILCNGGPMAHAEAVNTFLSLHSLDTNETRLLHLGFAAGRFPFSSAPYGVVPRSALEKLAWPVVRGKIFQEATEIFLRLLRGDIFSSSDVTPKSLRRTDFRTDTDWQNVLEAHGQLTDAVELAPWWTFERTGIIPKEVSHSLLRLVIGSHEPKVQEFANTILPCGVFNLSITPSAEIENVHSRMQSAFHADGGPWNRWYMPRTVLVFVDNSTGATLAEKRSRAQDKASRALKTYWNALEGTLDPERIGKAINNALVGSPEDVAAQIRERFHPDDRLMLWFDFFNHDNTDVKATMRTFMTHVVPLLSK